MVATNKLGPRLGVSGVALAKTWRGAEIPGPSPGPG
jgi:hypothetical protein